MNTKALYQVRAAPAWPVPLRGGEGLEKRKKPGIKLHRLRRSLQGKLLGADQLEPSDLFLVFLFFLAINAQSGYRAGLQSLL